MSDTQRTAFQVMYYYEWQEGIPLDQRNTPKYPSRPFCGKLMELDRLYSRKDIEAISERLGYSVWDRWGVKGAGTDGFLLL
jgi:hypothetical protein